MQLLLWLIASSFLYCLSLRTVIKLWLTELKGFLHSASAAAFHQLCRWLLGRAGTEPPDSQAAPIQPPSLQLCSAHIGGATLLHCNVERACCRGFLVMYPCFMQWVVPGDCNRDGCGSSYHKLLGEIALTRCDRHPEVTCVSWGTLFLYLTDEVTCDNIDHFRVVLMNFTS